MLRNTYLRWLNVLLLTVLGLTSLAHSDISFIEPLATPLTFPNGGTPIGIAKGDFDGDGNLDLAVTQVTNVPGMGTRGFVSVMLGNGDGTFQAPTNIPLPTTPVVAFGRGILARDFDRDGKLDLVVDSPELRQVLFYKGRGDGTFEDPVASTVTHRSQGLQTDDLDGDEVLDLVTVNTLDDTVTVLLGNGDGTFRDATNYSFRGFPVDVAIADINNDGAPDLVVGGQRENRVDVLLNDGNGRFGSAISSDARGRVRGLYVADFDGDGKPDVVVSIVARGTSAIDFMKGLGDGRFMVPAGSNLIPVEENPSRWITENVAPDLDGDGRPDVVFAHFGGGLLSRIRNFITVGLGQGDGTFTIATWVASPGPGVPTDYVDEATTATVAFGDFNNDGVVDIVVNSFEESIDSFDRPGGVSVLLGDNPGSFLAPHSYQTHRNPSLNLKVGSSALGDFNNDKKLDLAVITNGIEVLPGHGDGTFGAPISTETPPELTEFPPLRAADFDGDGNLDLLHNGIGRGSECLANVSYGLGDGTFGSRSSVRLESEEALCGDNLVVGDFNNDGSPDFAVLVKQRADGGGNVRLHIEVYTQTEPRTFIRTAGFPEMDLQFRTNGRAVGPGMVAADFDRDGKLDIVVMGGGPSGTSDPPARVLFFKGNGNGTFQPPTVIASGLPPIYTYKAADLDGDGNLDLVGAGGNGVFVQLGQGDGTFDDPIFYRSGFASSSLEIADLDADGALDLAVSHAGNCRSSNGFAVLPGNGDGTFRAPIPFAVGDSCAETVGVGDLNGDGLPDVVVGHPGEGNNYATVLINNSLGP